VKRRVNKLFGAEIIDSNSCQCRPFSFYSNWNGLSMDILQTHARMVDDYANYSGSFLCKTKVNDGQVDLFA
jgi:hypothetical protein